MAEAHRAGHEHAHPPHLAHHFDTLEQQFDSGKLGMWIFLATEILLFGGLFCAYAVYRGNHPEIFFYAQEFLSTALGATNTVILLSSSLTMAWAVRAAQLGQKSLLVGLLSLTLVGGCGFMVIKFFEYREKFSHGLLWASAYHPEHLDEEEVAGAVEELAEAPPIAHPGPDPAPTPEAEGLSTIGSELGTPLRRTEGEPIAQGASGQTRTEADRVAIPEERSPAAAGVQEQEAALAPPARADSTAAPPGAPGGLDERTALPPPAAAPRGLADVDAVVHEVEPANVRVFFSIYFLMTGLHGLHVLAGMGAIAWILVRALRGEFGPAYFTPVDLVGLYWHLVDLIWIFLFPLLYLIG